MTTVPDLQRGFELGPFSVLPERNLVRWESGESHLEPKQMQALVTLAQHQPGVVGKQLLVDDVWGGRATSDESITGCIKGLRAALDNDSPRDPKYIETIHGRGYRLKLPPVVAQTPPTLARPRNWLPGVVAAVLIAATAGLWMIRSTTPPTPEQIDSVVITRFANMSSEATQPTVDGFTEQLVSTLYEVPNLRIKKGDLPSENDTATDLAERYDVGWVVFGSVQQMGGQIKITARIDDRNNLVEWARTFEGTDKQIFELHEEVATQLRDAIRGKAEESVIASSRPANSEAYGKYLLGQFYLAKRNPASLNQAVASFKQSIEMDFGYGPAYLDLANAYLLLADYDYSAKERLFDLAMSTAEQGVARDPNIYAASQTIQGYVHAKRGDWQAATEAFEVATSGVADYPVSHHYHSILLEAVGRREDSFDAAFRAWEMEPDTQVLNSRLAITYFWKGDMENARRYYDIANTMGPGAPIAQLSYAMFLLRDGRAADARDVVRRAIVSFQLDPSWIDPVFDEMAKLPTSGAMSAILEVYAARNIIPPSALVFLWAITGQTDKAMDFTWQLVDDPSFFDIELIYLDEFSALRQHVDFPRFLDKMGLTEYWQDIGCQWENDQLSCGTS
jgi:DNA-binding winged helix-turn-helix (wHTH) protein/TolB-like protein